MSKTALARDLMKHPVRQLTARTPVRDAAAFLLRQGISGAPVVDEHGQWIGVFTQNDLARYMQNRLVSRRRERSLESREAVADFSPLSTDKFGETPVREFMTAGLFTVFPEASLEEVIHTLTTFKVHRVFVIDEDQGDLQGVITTMDVLRWMEQQSSVRTKNRKTQQA